MVSGSGQGTSWIEYSGKFFWSMWQEIEMKFTNTTCKDLGLGVPSRGNSKCKDPMAGASLVCSGNSKTPVAR